MTMTYLMGGIVVISVIFGFLTGQTEQVASASMEGAGKAVELSLSIGGMICLWTGIMEGFRQCGWDEKLAKMLQPALGRLFPEGRKNPQVMSAVSANLSANLLGLGNAATPLGIQAAKELSKGQGGVASHSLCLLVVCNTASVQLIPATVAALRSGAGSATPFDILPGVWVTSLASVTVGILACQFWGKVWNILENRGLR